MIQLQYVTRNSRLSLSCAIYSNVGILQWTPRIRHILPHETCPDLEELPRLKTPNAPTCSPVKYGQTPQQLCLRQIQGCVSRRTSVPQFQRWGYHPSVYLRTSNPLHSARVRTLMRGRKILLQKTSSFPTAHARARPKV